jgi:UDP-N-acetylglucosamine--N-acetylmuramyl-(pentapeptide) pyrophosphoryl-undecaprenol N-acetylglucosamine transferase
MALVRKDAGMIVTDAEAAEKLMKTACELMENPEKIALMEKNVAKLALADAAMTIAEEVYKTIKP